MEIQTEEEMAEEIKEEEEEIKEEELEAMVEIDLVQVAEGVQLVELGQHLEAELVHQEDRVHIRDNLAEAAHQMVALLLLPQAVVQEEVPVLLVQEVDQEEDRHPIKMHLVELELPVAPEDHHLAQEGAFLLPKDLQLPEKVAHLDVDPQALEAQPLEDEEVEIQGCQLGLKPVMVHLVVHREDLKEALLAMDLRE